MNDTHALSAADYQVRTDGTIHISEAGRDIERTYRDAERAFDTLQLSWAGACLAALFVRHAWLQSARITLSASAEYDDQGGTYRSISNSVAQVVPVADAAWPETVIADGVFDGSGAIGVIESHLDEIDFDLYSSIRPAPGGYGDVVLDLNRAAIVSMLNGETVSGAQAYRAWFPDAQDPPPWP